jgi:hypothetical protein
VRSKASACGASAFYVQAQAAKVGARVVGIHSVNPLHDGKVSCWFDIDKTNENEGIIICHIDQAELMQLDGPHELLALVRGDSEMKH